MEDNKQNQGIRMLMGFAGKKKASYVTAVLVALAGAGCQIAPFFVMADIIVMLMNGVRYFPAYGMDFTIMVLLWLGRICCHGISTSFSHMATFAVLGNMRQAGLEKLSRMPLGDIDKKGSGEIKNTLVERIDSIETTLAHIVPEVPGNIAASVVMVISIFIMDWRMGLSSLCTVPLGLACYMLMMIGYEPKYKRTVKATKDLNDTAVEYINGIEVIKVFGKAKSSYDRFVAAAREGAASYVDWMRSSNFYFTFALNILPATLLSVLPIGGLLVMKGSLDIVSFITVIIISMGMITPIIQVMGYSDDVAKLGTVLGEVASILSARELPRPEKDEETPRDSSIRLSDVHFSYMEGREVLHGINAEFMPGTVNALVGPSGGGKSTIAKLIASFWDADSGKIEIGGADIRKLSQRTSQKMIAYVSQDGFLFDDTVRENIRMGKPDATDAEVEAAAEASGCHDFIMSLEKGYDTVVGGSGSHLSGGEKQRITIARAMLKDSPIIIFDEATAYTDPENEALIQRSVAKLVEGKTVIVIAHRLSTITDSDTITVIADGNVEARGKHEELLHESPLYKTLWESHMSVKDTAEEGGIENV